MKIICDSCGAKYTVSDEKVQGKTVKVKCRKCSAVIVVSSTGDVSTTGGEGSAPAEASAGGAGYTVAVSDGDQRTMTVEEIVNAYNEGYVDADGLLKHLENVGAPFNEALEHADILSFENYSICQVQ